MDWISVNDNKPQPHEPVLVLLADSKDYQGFNNMQVAYHNTAEWIGKHASLENVTHWLPLPLPPPPVKNEHFEAIRGAADSILAHHVPDDATLQKFSFDIVVEGIARTVHYQKDPEGYWEFSHHE